MRFIFWLVSVVMAFSAGVFAPSSVGHTMAAYLDPIQSLSR
jgi:H+/Cl- antiporter ClcA